MIGVVFCSVEPVSFLSMLFSGHTIGVLKMFFILLFSSEFNLYGSVCVAVVVDSVVFEDAVVDVVVEVVEVDVVVVEVVVDVVTIL